MWWSYGSPMWGFWWVFPLMGCIFMLVMMLFGFRTMRGGGMCGFHREDSDAGALRKEITDLRSEIEALRKAKGV